MFKVYFRNAISDAIGGAISWLIEQVKSQDHLTPYSAISTLAKLADHGELKPSTLMKELTYIQS